MEFGADVTPEIEHPVNKYGERNVEVKDIH